MLVIIYKALNGHGFTHRQGHLSFYVPPGQLCLHNGTGLESAAMIILPIILLCTALFFTFVVPFTTLFIVHFDKGSLLFCTTLYSNIVHWIYYVCMRVLLLFRSPP